MLHLLCIDTLFVHEQRDRVIEGQSLYNILYIDQAKTYILLQIVKKKNARYILADAR